MISSTGGIIFPKSSWKIGPSLIEYRLKTVFEEAEK